MAVVHETAYPHLSANITKSNLQRIYTPNDKELIWLKQQRLTRESLLVASIYLKCFQRLGYFPKLENVPDSINFHIASCLMLDFSGSHNSVPPSTQGWLKNRIRHYCGVSKFTLAAQGNWIKETAKSLARTKENIIDIINALLEILIKEQFELPAQSTLERIAYSARAQCNAEYFEAIEQSIPNDSKQRLLNLLTEMQSDGTTLWTRLKYEPEKPSVRNLQHFIKHTTWIKDLQAGLGLLPELPEEKRLQFYYEAQSFPSNRMKGLKYKKRIALMALVVHENLLRSTDFLVDLFIREIRKLHSKAQLELKNFQLNSVTESEQLICMLRDVSLTLSRDTDIDQQRKSILSVLDNNPEHIVSRCDRLVTYGLNNPLPFLPKRYTKPLRKALLDCLTLLDIDHTAYGSTLLACVKGMLHYRDESMKTITVSALTNFTESSILPIDWIKSSWYSVLFVNRDSRVKNRVMHSNFFELCILSEVARRFQSGDLYVGNSTKYDDYRTHLVSWDTFNERVKPFCEVAGLNTNPRLFVSALKQSFVETAEAANERIPKDSHVVLENGKLVLKKRKREAQALPDKTFEKALKDQLGEINIIDLLVETTQWLDLGKKFGPLSGHQRKVRDYQKRLVATLFCYGCNLGPTQTARSIKEISRKQVAYLNLSHTREKDLVEATESVINAYNEYQLPGYWGDGKTASVDGTRFDMYEQNLMSEYHLRYASYGGIGYYLVSDKYIALFSRFIPCGVREALHLIDGILENTSDIQPDTIHGDTHAQSTVVFGLAHLLGIKLMPRIKDINSLVFFKPDGRASYPHIDSLFSENINYSVIREHYRDMLRIAVSISEGKVSASTIIRRLGSKGIRNTLYYAFRELGRVVRTQFLLQYVSDVELRETVQAATCKSEEFNNFVQWVFFYNNGQIQENLRYAQDKVISYNHLVANLVILHNVNAMSKAINRLKKKGVEITPEMMSGLSPYRNEHINLLGDYSINMSKRVEERHIKLI